MKKPKKVVITGALGQIAYSLIFRILSGELFGGDEKIDLALVDIEPLASQFPGLLMEIEDAASPFLSSVAYGSDTDLLFQDAEYIFLIGAKPRTPGMERKDLLSENGAIFQKQGRSINLSASRNVKALIVGNPCNTNCLIAIKNAPDLPYTAFASMSSLDELRARALLAKKLEREVSDISSLAVWGNHSSTQVPDGFSAFIRSSMENISERLSPEWLSTEFLQIIQERGARVLKERGKSSAASAAHAAMTAMKTWIGAHKHESFSIVSFGRYSLHNPYGIDEDIVFSFPSTVENGLLEYDTHRWRSIPEMLANSIKKTERELIEERELVRHLFQ